MISLKRFLVLCAAFAVCSFRCFAQLSIDPNDHFYELAQQWEIRGLVKQLPPLRPYSVASIKNILQNVIKRGNEEDVEIAIEYWQRITGKVVSLSLETEATGTVTKADGDDWDPDKLLTVKPAAVGDASLYQDWITIGYDLGITARTEENDSPFRALYVNAPFDARQDPAELGPLYGYLDTNAGVAVGNNTIFLQAGLNRTGYGPFLGEGLALNETGYHSANLSFTLMKEKFSYTQQYSAVGATLSYDGSGLQPEKYVAFHALEYKFTPSFSASYYENIVYGNRFDFSYFLPVPYMAAQGIGGNSDNLQMGLLFKKRFLNSLQWSTDLFIDDFDVNKLAKGDLNSKNRFALKTGLTFVPESGICETVSFNYTAISPYTYSHWDYDSKKTASISSGMYNYQNYTNNGVNVGSQYMPNTDVFSFTIAFKPMKQMRLGVTSLFLRHANIVESDTDDEAMRYLLSDSGTYATDGTNLTHSMFGSSSSSGDHVETAWENLNFLKQSHKMYVFQTGLNASYTLPKFAFGTLTLDLSYLFQYVHNKGVDTNMYPGGRVAQNADGTFSIDRHGSYTKHQVVQKFKTDWEKSLFDEISHFFTIGLKYRF